MRQYLHDNHYSTEPGWYVEKKPSRTFAFDLPDYDMVETEVMKTVLDNQYIGVISFPIGIARLHENDKYVKSIGRSIADSKMMVVDFAIRDIMVYPEDSEIKVRLVNDNLQLRMVMRKNYRNVRILSASL